MKKVLITGACGYLGAKLSKYLAEKGYSVTAFDSFDPSGYNQWSSLMYDVVVGNIQDEKIITKLSNEKYDVVIHLISLDHHKSEDKVSGIVSAICAVRTPRAGRGLFQAGYR